MEKIKTNPVSMKVHPEFRDNTVEDIITNRIEKGLETRKKPSTCSQITKIIHNFFEANPKFKNMLCEVRINGN